MRQKPDRSATIVPASVLLLRRQQRAWRALAWAHPALSQTAACFALAGLTFTDDEVLQFGQRLAAGLPPVEPHAEQVPSQDDGEPHSR